MKAKIIHVLCEGQTEQGFVEEVLRPYLQAQGVAGVDVYKRQLPIFTRKVGGLIDFFENGKMGYISSSLDPAVFAEARRPGQ